MFPTNNLNVPAPGIFEDGLAAVAVGEEDDDVLEAMHRETIRENYVSLCVRVAGAERPAYVR